MTTPTIVTHKDQLIVAVNEWDTAQKTAHKARHHLHCIIAALPDGEPEVTNNRMVMPDWDRPLVIHPHQNGATTEKQTSRTPPKSILEIRRNRPVVTAAIQHPDVATTEPAPKPTVDQKPKPKRAKRVSETDIRRAVKLFVDGMNTDSPLTQKQAEKAAGIPQGALSKGKGKEILDNCMRAMSRIAPRIAVPAGARRKAVEDATVYDDLR